MHSEQLELPMETRREWEDAIGRLGDHVREVEAARFALGTAHVASEANDLKRLHQTSEQIGRR